MGRKFSVRGLWVYGYETPDNLLIAPVVINMTNFPIGVAVYSSEGLLKARTAIESKIGDNLPLPGDQKIVHYQIGKDIEFEVYCRAVLHMYRMGVKQMDLGGIKNIAEDEFRKAKVILDSTVMQLDADTLKTLRESGRVRRLRDIVEVNIAEVIRWRPT